MKTLALIMFVLAVPIYQAIAQPGCGMKHHGHGMGNGPDSTHFQAMNDKLATELSLTEEQKAKMTQIHQAHFDEMKALREKERNEHLALREKMGKDMKSILTPEQVKKFDEIMADHRGPHHKQHME